jgi:N6-L-threonylcarbamoyladenine synthase
LKKALLLAFETSCDETAVAVMAGSGDLRASVVASQAEVHAVYGGVVPEVASRNHAAHLRALIAECLDDAGLLLHEIDVFAATTGPGLPSALLVGVAAAKGLALACERPFVAVNHIEGHLLSPFFGRAQVPACLGLVVSGGHTLLVDVEGAGRYRLLGRTLDDAAGEAFDKVAKLMGLPYPGGPEVEREARQGNPARFELPRSMMCSGDFNFSFSGLKTAVRYLLPKTTAADRPDVCAGFQDAVVEVLVDKAVRAARERKRSLIAVSGGVGLNGRLRETLAAAATATGLEVLFAEPWLCGDNAAMIAYAAAQRGASEGGGDLAVDIAPTLVDSFFQSS